ncbi:MAG: calcium/sodium antiporter [Cardiobacteriaceae bacterium]|nr:calcium/sodium antiporter [Cardiobacteriaceae bacterium]
MLANLNQLIAEFHLLFAILAVFGGLITLLWSADKFISGSADVANFIGIPALLIGILIVGFGTSAPEMLVSAVAAMEHKSELALGNAYGSNICNIALILGLTALIKPIHSNKVILLRDLPILFSLTLFSAYQIYDGVLSRTDAIVLLVLFVICMSFIILTDLKREKIPEAENSSNSAKDINLFISLFWLFFGLILLVASSKILVWGAVEIAHIFKISDLIIGLTIVAVGTSLPELASSITAARKNHHDIVLGNIIGSNIFNLLCVVGIAGSIYPATVGREVLYRDFLVMALLNFFLFIFLCGRGQIGRTKGAILLLTYITYTAYLIYEVINNL